MGYQPYKKHSSKFVLAKPLNEVVFSQQELELFFWFERNQMSDLLTDEMLQRKRVLMIKAKVMRNDYSVLDTHLTSGATW